MIAFSGKSKRKVEKMYMANNFPIVFRFSIKPIFTITLLPLFYLYLRHSFGNVPNCAMCYLGPCLQKVVNDRIQQKEKKGFQQQFLSFTKTKTTNVV